MTHAIQLKKISTSKYLYTKQNMYHTQYTLQSTPPPQYLLTNHHPISHGQLNIRLKLLNQTNKSKI